MGVTPDDVGVKASRQIHCKYSYHDWSVVFFLQEARFLAMTLYPLSILIIYTHLCSRTIYFTKYTYRVFQAQDQTSGVVGTSIYKYRNVHPYT